jgi:hypothetical protein
MASAPILSPVELAQSFHGRSTAETEDQKGASTSGSSFTAPLALQMVQDTIARRKQSEEDSSPVIDEAQKSKARATSSTYVWGSQKANTVVDVPHAFTRRRIENRSVNTLQEWEGLVESIDRDCFTARIRDLTNSGNPEEIATIPLEEVDPDELPRVVPGALFHLFIGFTRRGGSRRRETFTYFRKHLPGTNSVGLELADLLSSFDE